MGTLTNGLDSVFNIIAESIGVRWAFQLVLAIGPTIDFGSIRSSPESAVVVSRAPQPELLKRSALCITHAGLNTALECLSMGVPMVAIPITNDQPGVAARIAHARTGAFVPLEELNIVRLSGAIEEVLTNPDYAKNASSLKEAMARANGVEKAVDLLEMAFGLK